MQVNQAQVQKDILKEIDSFCEQHNLSYCLMFGTLLGAVRHKDLIPWDDDIDIMMPRSDYDRFCKLWKQEMADSHLQLFLPLENENYPHMIARLSDSRYPIDISNEQPCGMGLFVDIYPFDGMGNTAIGTFVRAMAGDVASSLCFQSTRLKFPKEMFNNPAMRAVGFCAFKFSKAVGTRRIMQFIQRIPARDYYRSKFVGCLGWINGGMEDVFRKAWFDRQIRMSLGDETFWAPEGYDSILKQLYGNYLKLPPAEEQVGHHNYTLAERPLCPKN